MKYLGIDTSTNMASVALAIDGIGKEKVIGQDYRQSAMIITAIEELLEDSRIVLGDIHGIACVAGPGSFTGLRVGMCTAKALSYSVKVPLYAVSALKAMAWQIGERGYNGKACVMMDARNDQVYMGCYQVGQGMEPVAIMEDKAGSIKDLLPEAFSVMGENILLAGTGVYAHVDMIPPKANVIEGIDRPSALAVAVISDYMACDGRNVDPVTAAPNYLRKSQAERARDGE